MGLHNTSIAGTSNSNIIDLLFNEVLRRDPSDASMFDWALLAYSLLLTNRYEWCVREWPCLDVVRRPSQTESVLPLFLERLCDKLTLETLPLSGWMQYIIYLTLYCTDVERPLNESAIKKSVPFEFQESLHIRWLNEILVHAQPQVRVYMLHVGIRTANSYMMYLSELLAYRRNLILDHESPFLVTSIA